MLSDVAVLVPARRGSTRLKNKNNLKLGELSLVNISATQGRRIFPGAEVYVSTNDPETACRAFGRVIDRPEALASNEAPTINVIKHALESIPNEWVCLLQPTNPFRDVASIREQVLRYGRFDSYFTAVEFHGFLWNKDAECLSRMEGWPRPRSQEQPELWHEDGAFYLFNRKVLEHKDFIFGNKKRLVGSVGVDIHTHEDYMKAQRYWKNDWLY